MPDLKEDRDMPNLKEDREQLKLALDHAWAWFTIHATQRLQAVNYFLIAAAFLFAAFVAAAKEPGLQFLAGFIALLGVIVSLLFYKIERRIRSLIHASEAALKPLQRRLADLTTIEQLTLAEKVEEPSKDGWAYSRVFKYLYSSAGGVFAIAFIYSIIRVVDPQPTCIATPATKGALSVSLIAAGYITLINSPEHIHANKTANIAFWAHQSLGAAILATGTLATLHTIICR